jgi:hypothetical protein
MIRFLYDNRADDSGATLTASAEANPWPKENVKHPYRGKAWRSKVDTSDQWLKWDLGSAKAVNCVALIGHNFNSDNVIKIQGNATDSWASPTVNETIAYHERIMIKFFTQQSLRWWQVVASGQTEERYHQIGRVFFGTYFQPSRNFLVNWTHTVADSVQEQFTVDGSRYADERLIYPEFGIEFVLPVSEKYGDFDSLIQAVGVSKNLFIALDPDNQLNELSVYGRILDIGEWTDLGNNWSKGSLKLVGEP